MKTTLLLAAMPAAAVAFSVRPGAEQSIKAADSPLFQPVYYSRPTHSSRRRSRLMLWRRNKSNSQYKLQAYTVAPEDRILTLRRVKNAG